MNYSKYIELGFKRHELNCSVEKKQTGYGGFSLEIDVNKKISICATSGNLDKPKLYIRKRNKDEFHIIDITDEIVIDLLYKKNNYEDDYTQAC